MPAGNSVHPTHRPADIFYGDVAPLTSDLNREDPTGSLGSAIAAAVLGNIGEARLDFFMCQITNP